MTENWQTAGFGLYLHWPFCAAKCPYCDFNSHVSAHIDHDVWKQAYLREIDRTAALTTGRVLRSIYFGGGTPSLMSPDTVDAILTRIADHWTLANDIEITLEANPGSIEAARFRAFAQSGVNRVSMGIQALNDADLKRLGRLHTLNEARAGLVIAQGCFDRVSFDLIYARQDQTLAGWQTELSQALSMGVDHLSLYQLTIEPGTAFWDRRAIGRLKGLPDEDLACDMYELTQSMCETAGLPAYEVSNHARLGSESQHNQIYWEAGDWIGIGPGAHGRLTLASGRRATETHLAPGAWLKAVMAGSGEAVSYLQSPQDIGSEYLMMGLRTNKGLDIDRYSALGGVALQQDRLRDLENIGLLVRTESHLRTTQAGRLVLNSIVSQLMPDQDDADNLAQISSN